MAGLNIDAGVRRFSGRLLGVTSSSRREQSDIVSPGGGQSETDRLLGPSHGGGHESFRAARQEAINDVAQEITYFRCIGTLVGAIVVAFFFYIEVKSILVLTLSRKNPCDGPLWGWLMVRVILVCSTALCARLHASARIAWVLLGYQWLNQVHTCASTAPELFSWIRFVLFVDVVWISTLVSMQLLLLIGVLTFVVLVEQGYIANPRAARVDTLVSLEKVEFNEDSFAPADAVDDGRPSRECCCCCEDFCADKAIVVTPCKHYFHEACLGDWLKLARTCPLCRCDLDEATRAKLP